jgi:hypothetical protein
MNPIRIPPGPLSAETARKIERLLNYFDAMDTKGSGPKSIPFICGPDNNTNAVLNPDMRVVITGVGGAGFTNFYSWVQTIGPPNSPQYSNLISWNQYTPAGAFGTVTPSIVNPAIEANGAPVVIGSVVKLRRSYYDPTYDWVFEFDASSGNDVAASWGAITYTTVAGSVGSGVHTVTPANMAGIVNGANYYYDTATNQETITITATTPTTFTAAFANSHGGGVSMAGAPTPISGDNYWPGNLYEQDSDTLMVQGNFVWIIEPNNIPPAPNVFYKVQACIDAQVSSFSVYGIVDTIPAFPVKVTAVTTGSAPFASWMVYTWKEQKESTVDGTFTDLPAGRCGFPATNPLVEVNNDTLVVFPFIAWAKFHGIVGGQFVYDFDNGEGLVIEKSGSAFPQEPILNFIPGSNVTIGATDDPGNHRTNITISASSSSSSTTVDHNGSLVGTEPILNFIDGVYVTWTIADNPGATRIDITPVFLGIIGEHNTASPVGPEPIINFIDTALITETVVKNVGNGSIDVTITSKGLSAEHNGGATIGPEPIFNFIDSTLITWTVTNNAGATRVDITPTSLGVYGEHNTASQVGPQTTLNFIDKFPITWTVANNAGNASIDITPTTSNFLKVTVYDANGTYTWTPQTNTATIVVEVLGAGGGGGGADDATVLGQPVSGIGGGGGSGAYSRSVMANPGATTVTVGAGGGGGTGFTNGSDGTGSAFANGSSPTAGGGKGGISDQISIGFIRGGNAGTAGAGDVSGGGQDGLPGIVLTPGLNPRPAPASAEGGAGGNTLYGGGGHGGGNNYATNDGASGHGPGAGGGGAISPFGSSSQNGGNGVDGLVVVWEFSF